MPVQLQEYDFENPAFLDLGSLELNKIWMVQSGIDFEGSIYEYGEKVKEYATEKGYSLDMRIPHGKFLILKFTEGNGSPIQSCYARENLP